VEHTKHVIYIYIVGLLLTGPSTNLLAHSFSSTYKNFQKKQPMALSGKNLSAAMLLIVIVAALV